MPIKKRFLECDCGEQFVEGKNGLEGKIEHTCWVFKDSRVRSTKADNGGDIAVTQFHRSGLCRKCKGVLVTEEKAYELSPAGAPGEKDHAVTSVSREFVMTSDDKK